MTKSCSKLSVYVAQ